MSEVTVKIGHLRTAKLCMSGCRRWFKSHDLDWSDFLANGIPSSILGQWGDPLAARAIAVAEKEYAHGG